MLVSGCWFSTWRVEMSVCSWYSHVMSLFEQLKFSYTTFSILRHTGAKPRARSITSKMVPNLSNTVLLIPNMQANLHNPLSWWILMSVRLHVVMLAEHSKSRGTVPQLVWPYTQTNRNCHLPSGFRICYSSSMQMQILTFESCGIHVLFVAAA